MPTRRNTMAELRFEAHTSERLDLARTIAWANMSELPEAFAYFPLINQATELTPDELYELELGPFGYKGFSTNVDCQVTVVTRPEEEIRFESVPDTGNADVEAAMNLDGDEEGCTLEATLIVSPRIAIPRFVPKGILEKTASATLRTGLQHALRNFRRELEGDAQRSDTGWSNP
jgi:hypothetical protein